jgi:L-aspartate oxidase
MLDTRGIDGSYLEKRFPSIFKKCLELGTDIRKEPIPVVPAAHYFCGGIKVDLKGQTSIPGLYAAGENACTGVHGANRLASVSLLEGMLWGRQCGLEAVKNLRASPENVKKTIPDWVYPPTEELFDYVLVRQDLRAVRSTMWNYAGIIRSKKRLTRALADLDYLSHRVQQFYRSAKLSRDIIELRNSVLAANIIVRAALVNPASVGCHFVE